MLDPGRWTAVACLTAVFAAQVAFDWLRLRRDALNQWFFRAFRHLASPRETHAPVSSTWYTAGVMLALAVLPREAASSGILLLAVADPVASIVGRLWGRRRFLGGSMEGSAAFAVAALAVLWLRHPPIVAVTGALLSTLAERLAWPWDDNLVLPVAAGSGVWLLGALL
jgi:dolichol kinase